MIEKILIVRLGSLGDIIHTIPAVQVLAKKHPQTSIHWLTEPAYVELLEHAAGISKVWAADTKRWRKQLRSVGEIRKLVSSLRKERFDLTFDFQGLVKSALLARLSGGRKLIGFSGERLRERPSKWFYTLPTPVEAGQRHQVVYNHDLVEPPRFREAVSAHIDLQPPTKDQEYVETEFSRLQLEKPVILNPGGGWETKRWAPERFGVLAARIEDELGLPTLFTYGPGEENLIERAVRSAGRELKHIPTTILQLAALFGRSRLVVAGDTGPMHLAVAQGTSVVAILGPAHDWRTGPFNAEDVIVKHERACPNPYKRSCREHFCMDIPVDRVFCAVQERLSREPL